MQLEITEQMVWQGLFESAWGPYRYTHFFIPKMNHKYHIMSSSVSRTRDTLEKNNMPPTVEEFSAAFHRLPISSLIDFHYGFDWKVLHKNSQNYMAVQTMHGMYQLTSMVQGYTNLVLALLRVTQNMVHARP